MIRYYFWLPFSFVLGNQKHNIVSLDVYLTSFQYCFLFTIARLGPTNMAAVNSRDLQKPLAENNRIRYPVLFSDQCMEYVEVLKDVLIKNNLEKIKEIELTCFADIYSLVEDAAGNWRPDKLKRDDFAGGLLSERMKNMVFQSSSERNNNMVIAGRYVDT